MQHNRDGEQKSYKLLGLFNFLLFVLFSSLLSASFEDFKRQQESSFNAYRDTRDAQFNQYLKTQWEEYSAKESVALYEKQKPKTITRTSVEKIKSVGPLINVKLPKAPKEETKIQLITVDPLTKSPKADINFNFFGEEIGLNVRESIKKAKFYPYSQTGIANFFETIASSDYEDLVQAIRKKSATLELNDWGVYLLVDAISKNIFQGEDDAKLFTWFVLNKLKYNVKVGLSSKHVVLMHYSEKIIYATPSYQFENKKFYVVSDYAKPSFKKVYTYKQEYPNATKALDLSLVKIPKFPNKQKEKNLTFKQYDKEYAFTFNYNQNIIDFMATYPQADYETYFNAPMQEETYKEIAKGLKEYVDGMQASVAINFVLNFVQNAFKYERDKDQFNREKVMFAQETLYYDKSDCEDRAVLFSYLVKKLFKIGVIGVKYKDHMATGLSIPMSGDSVNVGNKKYVIADPTYLNANIGQSMPKYKSIIPQSFIMVQRDGA